MSLYSLLSIGSDGLMAHQGALNVTSENVSNVNTPGYARRGAVFETRGFPGFAQGGVTMAAVSRSFNIFAYRQVVAEAGKRGSAQARESALSELQNTMAPGAGLGISDAANKLFDAFTQMSTDASDPTMRTTVLARANDLANKISTSAGEMTRQRADLLQQGKDTAAALNQQLSKIASLNSRIAQATAKGERAEDLRDQRDSLVRSVSEGIGVKVIEDEGGQLTLFSSGSVLVEGRNAAQLDVSLDPGNNMSFELVRPSGSRVNITTGVTQGSLGGLREVRDVDIVATQTALDQYAFDLTTAMNTLHQSGFGLDGNTGRDLFSPQATVAGAAYAMSLDPAMVGQPNFVGAAGSAADVPGGNAIAIAIAQLQAQSIGAGGTPSETMASLMSDIGLRLGGAKDDLLLRQATVAQAESLSDQYSGVSLDEEMINLSRYQTAFEASTRVLQVADELLELIVRGF